MPLPCNLPMALFICAQMIMDIRNIYLFKQNMPRGSASLNISFLPCFDSTFHSYKTTLFRGQTILISIANPVTLTKAGNCAGNCVEGSLSVLATVGLAARMVTRPGPGDPA